MTARKADDSYLDNPFFSVSKGRVKLGLSLLDVLVDTSQWIGWDRHFGPFSGHQNKLKEEALRKILTTFAYGTGLESTQTARNIVDISARQISFVDQCQAGTEKLEAAITDKINAYNQFELPRYWGDTRRAAADDTQ